jgi:hypothetical protein
VRPSNIFYVLMQGHAVTSGRWDRASPAVSPVRPSPPLLHHGRRYGDTPTLLGCTGTRHRHNGHCATYGLPVNSTLELAHHGGRSTNYYAATLEAAPVQA